MLVLLWSLLWKAVFTLGLAELIPFLSPASLWHDVACLDCFPLGIHCSTQPSSLGQDAGEEQCSGAFRSRLTRGVCGKCEDNVAVWVRWLTKSERETGSVRKGAGWGGRWSVKRWHAQTRTCLGLLEVAGPGVDSLLVGYQRRRKAFDKSQQQVGSWAQGTRPGSGHHGLLWKWGRLSSLQDRFV